MSDIERNDLEEVEPVAEVKQRKKRVLTDKQKEAVALNLAKGREKLKQVHLEKQVKRGEELEQKIIKKEKTSAKSKSTEDKRIELAMQALNMVRNKSDSPSENEDIVPTPRKKSIRIPKPEPDTETEVEEIIVKKSKPKKKTILYMDTETESEVEPVKPKRSYRKRVEDKKEQQEPISAPTPQPQIIFY